MHRRNWRSGRNRQGGWLQIAAAAVTAGVGYLSSRSASKAGSRAAAGSEALAHQQAEMGADLHDWWKQVYKPVEAGLGQEVEGAGGQVEQERAAGRADAAVTQQGGIASKDIERTFTDRGFGINDPRLLDAQSKLALGTAAERAGSQNDARERERLTGFAKRMDFANMGRSLPGQAASIIGGASSQLGGIAGGRFNQANANAYNAGYAVKPFVDAGINAIGNRSAANNDGGVTFDPNRHYISSGNTTNAGINVMGRK